MPCSKLRNQIPSSTALRNLDEPTLMYSSSPSSEERVVSRLFEQMVRAVDSLFFRIPSLRGHGQLPLQRLFYLGRYISQLDVIGFIKPLRTQASHRAPSVFPMLTLVRGQFKLGRCVGRLPFTNFHRNENLIIRHGLPNPTFGTLTN